MINIIPIEYYTTIYYNIILLVIIITWIHTQRFTGFSKNTFIFNKKAGLLLFWFILLYIGLRPISGWFGDMGTYAKIFDSYAIGDDPEITTDIGFYTLMKVLALFGSQTLFFFIMAVLYLTPIYIASKKWFPRYYFFAFLILVASFSFWSYGTNGLRNGIATSFMLLALSYKKNRFYKYALFLLSFSFHSSMLILIIAYFLTKFIKKTSFYFFGWFFSILLSLTMGSFWEVFFMSLGFGQEDKLQGYFGEKDLYKDRFSHIGFRWDFLIYSSFPIIIAYYFIFVKKINDKHYKQLVNIYLAVNAFWILVIRASFSNRFAYLSWFMMGIIIIYPFLKQVYWKNQFSIIGGLTLLYFSFTYIMNIFIY